jgi:1,4-dihydroxy-2-naphthoate octaprenyltransferase
LVTYSIGAAISYRAEFRFDLPAYLVGYACIFLIELATVLCNEYFDFRTDSLNKSPSMLTGGSRVLVKGKIALKEVQFAVIAIVFATISLGYALIRVFNGRSPLSIVILLLLGLFLGLGYTAPPLKFSYRGLGEVVVALTFGPYLVACGCLFQGGVWKSPVPMVVSLPLFFSILPSIILAGFPDRQADVAFSKRTLAVILGTKAASLLAIVFSILAALSGALLLILEVKPGILAIVILPALLHSAVLTASILGSLKTGFSNVKFDALLTLALAYIFWFSVYPLACLLWCPLEISP